MATNQKKKYDNKMKQIQRLFIHLAALLIPQRMK